MADTASQTQHTEPDAAYTIHDPRVPGRACRATVARGLVRRGQGGGPWGDAGVVMTALYGPVAMWFVFLSLQVRFCPPLAPEVCLLVLCLFRPAWPGLPRPLVRG